MRNYVKDEQITGTIQASENSIRTHGSTGRINDEIVKNFIKP